jgi:pre-mRNA-splicing factor ATP-dependent RNA helicase DHX15/PRP43
LDRLLEYATNYFDLDEFQDGETKRALEKAANKRAGKAIGGAKSRRALESNGESRPSKKQKKA